MIKEVAEEEVHLSSSQPIRKMTYKGEVEIEQPPSVCIMSVCVVTTELGYWFNSGSNILCSRPAFLISNGHLVLHWVRVRSA